MTTLINNLVEIFVKILGKRYIYCTTEPTITLDSRGTLSFEYKINLLTNLSSMERYTGDDIKNYLWGKIFQGSLGFYHFELKSIVFDKMSVVIILKYNLLDILNLYFDDLPQELNIIIASKISDTYEDQIIFIKLLGINMNDITAKLLLRSRYPNMYNILKNLNLDKFIDPKVYEYVTDMYSNLDLSQLIDIKQFVDDVLKDILEVDWEIPPRIIAELILYIDRPWIYSIAKKDELLSHNFTELFSDIYSFYDENSESYHSYSGVEIIDDAILEYMDTGKVPTGEKLKDIINVYPFELFEDNFIYWTFLLAIDTEYLGTKQKEIILNILKLKDLEPSLVLKNRLPKGYLFENAFNRE